MLCLYKNNVASEVDDALRSAFFDQDLPPSQLIAVFDGPIPDDVERVIADFERTKPVTRIIHETCRGHGPARSAAINACQYEWIAIVDADDISLPHRFSALAEVIASHPNTAVVGGGVKEFSMIDGAKVMGEEVCYPQTPEDVKRFIRSRSPIAQPSSILRVAAIKSVGGYQEWFNNEDYHLWIRLVAEGLAIRNVDRPVLEFRTSREMFVRRGGIRYWWNEVKLQLFSLRMGTTTIGRVLFGAAVRFAVQVLLPPKGREIFYKRILRRL